ncbi:MAG: hypothetical protein QY310_07805 [Candidatus Jettenia sp. CY-1]|nr:MAG: hypothetical protein QY310_07805 [Candidatus Jettenia sp. CY-1]
MSIERYWLIFKDVTKIFSGKTFEKEKGMPGSDAFEMLAARRLDHQR